MTSDTANKNTTIGSNTETNSAPKCSASSTASIVERRAFLRAAGLVGGYFVLCALVIGIGGNFPLNDDWMYGLGVRRMMETGQLHLYGGSPSCLMHIIVGTLLCKLCGFSFVTLRLCSISFAFAGCLLLYALLRQIQVHRTEATLATLILACNPIYTNLAYCFMTDVPALTYTLAYLVLLVLALKRWTWWAVPLSSVALMCAIAVRQSSAVLIAVNLVVAILLLRSSWRRSLTIVLLLVVLPTFCAYYIDHLMSAINEYPGAYDWYKAEITRLMHLALHKPFSFFFIETISSVRAAAYIGLFVSPLLPVFFFAKAWLTSAPRTSPGTQSASGNSSSTPSTETQPTASAAAQSAAMQPTTSSAAQSATMQPVTASTAAQPTASQSVAAPFTAVHSETQITETTTAVLKKDVAGYAFVALLLTMAAVTYLVGFKHKLMPFSINVMPLPNLGPFTIISGWNPNPAGGVEIVVTSACVLFSCALLFALACCAHRALILGVRFFRNTRKNEAAMSNTTARYISIVLVVLTCLVSFAWSAFHASICNLDRYFVSPVVFVIPCALLSARWLKVKCANKVAVALLLLLGTYTICAQHDYVAWNNARWQAIGELERAGVRPRDMDAGIEYDYTKDPALANDLQLSANVFRCVHRGTLTTSKYRWWSVHNEKYIVSLCDVPGYQVWRTFPYFNLLTFSNKSVLVLRSDASK